MSVLVWFGLVWAVLGWAGLGWAGQGRAGQGKSKSKSKGRAGQGPICLCMGDERQNGVRHTPCNFSPAWGGEDIEVSGQTSVRA